MSNNNDITSGPKLDSFQNFAIFHWNINSVTAHNFLKAYLTIGKTDIVCLSGAYLDSSFPVNDENLVIQVAAPSVEDFAFTT